MEKNCFYHKEIPTGLSCSRCNKPVCNKCTIDSLVGIKCKECGLIGTPHILVVNIFDYFKIFCVSLPFSLLLAFLYTLGLIMALNNEFLGKYQEISQTFFKILTLIFLVASGASVGEVVKRVSYKKINKFFPVISALSTLFLWICIYMLFKVIYPQYLLWWQQFFYGPVPIVGLGIAIYLSYKRLK